MYDRDRRARRFIFNSFVGVLGAAAFVYVLWQARTLILPILLGILFAYIFRPFKSAFKYNWLPNSLRITIILFGLTSALLMGVKIVKDNLPNEKEKLEMLVRMKYHLNEKFDKIMEINKRTGKGNLIYNLVSQDVNPIRRSLNKFLELTPEQVDQFLAYHEGVEGVTPISEKYFQYFEAEMKVSKEEMADMAKNGAKVIQEKPAKKEQSLLKTAMEIASIWFLFPIVFLFFLLDNGEISRFFIQLIPNRYFELALAIKEEVDQAIGKYLRGISLQCGLVGLSMAVGLRFIGVTSQMSIVIGALSGLATAIPFLSPMVGLGCGLAYGLIAEDIYPLVTFITLDNFPIMVISINALVLLLDNLVYAPIVLGGSVNLHPLVVILGITCASMIFGMAGVLLAVPAIVILKVVVGQTFRGLKDYRII